MCGLEQVYILGRMFVCTFTMDAGHIFVCTSKVDASMQITWYQSSWLVKPWIMVQDLMYV